EAGGTLKRVERAVDLDAVQPAAGVLELAAPREARRIEAVVPAPVGPAGDADAQVHAVHDEVRCARAWTGAVLAGSVPCGPVAGSPRAELAVAGAVRAARQERRRRRCRSQ